MAVHGQVWITRARPGAEATAARVEAMGRMALVAPVLEVRALPGAEMVLEGADALAFTSANGVRAFTALTPRRDLTAFCVGAATAAAARAAGLTAVSAQGDVAALADLLMGSLSPGAVVVHPRGREAAGDLQGALHGGAIHVRPAPLYETVGRTELPARVAARLKTGGITDVLAHSPKAARSLAALLAGAPLAGIQAWAISPAAAAPLCTLPFAAIAAAATPDEAALLSMLRA